MNKEVKSDESVEPASPALFRILKIGLRHAPVATKFAIGALVTASVAVAILSAAVSPPVLFGSIGGVAVTGLVVALFSQVSARQFKGPLGQTLAWILVI